MKILLLVAEHGYSFVNQAQVLAKGLSKLGVENLVERIDGASFPHQALEKFKPDVVLGVGSWHSYPFLVKKPKDLGYRVIPWIVSNGKINRYVDGYNQLNLILTPSRHCQQIFVRDGINEGIIKVLPEAVDSDFWHQLKEAELVSFLKLISIADPNLSLPFKFDLVRLHQEKIPIFFTTGGSATSKGAQEVIAALAKVNKKLGDKPWLYLIKTWPSVGSFSYSGQELRLAEKLGVLERIRYLVGEFSLEFIRALMSACDIYIAPSREEGFGLPLVEAQMCGKPVISIAATSTQEVVKSGTTGFLAKAEKAKGHSRANVDDLARHIERLLIDDSLRVKMGKRAKVWSRENFSPKTIAKKLLRLVSIDT